MIKNKKYIFSVIIFIFLVLILIPGKLQMLKFIYTNIVNGSNNTITIVGWLVSLITTFISVYVASKFAYKSSQKLNDLQIKQNYNNNIELKGIDVTLKIYNEMIEILKELIPMTKEYYNNLYVSMSAYGQVDEDPLVMRTYDIQELFKSLVNYSTTFNFFESEIETINEIYLNIKDREYKKSENPREKFINLIRKLNTKLKNLEYNMLKEQINFLKSKKID